MTTQAGIMQNSYMVFIWQNCPLCVQPYPPSSQNTMARKTMWGFIRDQWTKVPAVAKTDLSGKTVVVVGANVGLGFEAAKHFAAMNPQRLILVCRSKEKGEAAVAGCV